MTTQPRFGIWIPVYGNWAGLDAARETHDASFERAKRTLIEAESLGFETALFAQHIINPANNDLDQLETWTAAAALAALTNNIEIIAAIKPKLFHPVVLAKLALGIEDISRGRFAINLVNAWYRPEIEKAGITFEDHDDRYAYGREWIEIVKPLISGEEVTFSGKYFSVQNYRLRPASRFRERPRIYLGGESSPAHDLAADYADVFFHNGYPPEQIQRNIADVARRPRRGKPLNYAMAAFVIARESDDEARMVEQHFFHLKETLDSSHLLANVDPKAVMFHNLFKDGQRSIGTNGGTLAGLVGSYDTVADRIVEFQRLGISTFVLQFQPFLEEQRRFAENVIPRVRRFNEQAKNLSQAQLNARSADRDSPITSYVTGGI